MSMATEGLHSRSTTQDDNKPRTLYVGNLDASASEELILALFGVIGPVKGCKIIHENVFLGAGSGSAGVSSLSGGHREEQSSTLLEFSECLISLKPPAACQVA
ncbi:unnamed protein product [Notodromas monacha]|uniref:RRM domain-containing protein n=1 Tax=Notodromas monacha TaxID=399045 RepID=A0A7R9BN53_9CRUS|nr:unnamed protein product [Notodromas monacha]CAG0917189.1 unnamed protein product [Notodromas monacha]